MERYKSLFSEGDNNPKVGDIYINIHDNIKSKIIKLEGDTVHVKLFDKKSIEDEFGKGSEEVKGLFNSVDEVPLKDFLDNYTKE